MVHALKSAADERATVVYSLSDPWLAPVLAGQEAGHGRSAARTAYHAALKTLGIPDVPAGKDRLIFCSRSMQKEYEQMGADASRGTVIHIGVTPEKWPFRQQRILQNSQGPGGHTPRILYAGRIAPEKGVGTLIKAFARLHNQMGLGNTRLCLMGSVQSAGYHEY